jgi:hypothetical protein
MYRIARPFFTDVSRYLNFNPYLSIIRTFYQFSINLLLYTNFVSKYEFLEKRFTI